jgi:signal transduction histidine kinase/ActR/RegA family two-component response regulator
MLQQRALRLGGVAALIWVSLGGGQAHGQDRQFRIGTVSGQFDQVTADSYRPFTDYLSERVPGADFEMVPLANIEALVESVDAGRLHFALATPAALVTLMSRHEVRPIATVTQMVGEDAYPWLAGAVFVRRSRTDIQRLEDVRGKSIIALSPLALGGWLSAVREWRDLGLDEERDLGSIQFQFSYSKLAAEVCAGSVDAGVLAAGTLRAVASACPEGFRVLPGPGGSRDPRYPTDVSTRLYPEAAVAVVAPVDEQFVTAVTQQLLAITPGSDVATAATVAGFTAPLSYTAVRELMQQLRVGPFETFGQLTFTAALQQHAGKATLALLGFLSILTLAFARTQRLNRQLAHSLNEQKRAEQERAQLETQLQQSQRMDSIGRLAGAVAHDFNNLLTVINGYSEFVLMDVKENNATRRSLVQIQKAGRRAAELTQQLLTFSKKQISRPVPLNIAAVLDESDSMLRRLLGEEIQLVIAAPRTIALTMADPGQINQVLLNLVVNARDAMPQGGTLTITAADVVLTSEPAGAVGDIQPGPYVELCVRDTGSGIDPDALPHIFEPFFSTKGTAGTGLGLATVYGIVQQNLGGISVTSEPGQGTTFTIYLPQTDRQPFTTAVDSPKPIATAPGPSTVLVVEDQDDVRGFATAVLRAAGYDVLEAASGNEALARAETYGSRVDLLLTDVVLQGMNGRELSEQFKHRHPGARVLFTSGYADDVIARRGVLQGSIAFLPKPYSPERLLGKVRSVLEQEHPATPHGGI